MFIILSFSVWRIVDFIVSIVTPRFVPYLGFFPYREIFEEKNLPSFLTSLANFDGVHYILIAERGYVQFEQAFFPLYPLLIKAISSTVSPLFAGLLISAVSFFFGLVILKRLLKKLTRTSREAVWFVLLLLAYPASFFFGTVYTEGLFFLLFVGSIYFFREKKYLLAAIFAFLAALTKFIAIFLLAIFGTVLFIEYLNKKLRPISGKLILAVTAPIAGLFTYCGFLLATTGDPFFFFHSQKAFGGRDISSIILFPQVEYRYLKIFLTANPNFQYFTASVEFILFNLVLIVLLFDAYILIKHKNYLKYPYRAALSIFSFINLIVPTLTGTFASVPRYALFSFSFFLFLSQQKTPIKLLLFILFLILHILLLAFFIQGYFVS